MEMLKQVKAGRIQCIVVKDLSRFGRNYLEVGNYISCVFPFLDVRFIAVNDGFDSINPMEADSLEVSFKTLLYDSYSRDLSHKVKNALRFKAQQGKYIASFAPYGYVKDAKNKNRIIADPDAAENVQRIFHMAANGMSTLQIAREMNKEQILTPMQYKRTNGCGRTVWNCINENNFWTPETVIKILRDERYTGKAVFGRRKREEAGSIHQVKVSKADWITVENAHERIISQDEFNYAQEKLRAYAERGTVRKCKNLLYKKVQCGICGRSMIRTSSRKNPYYTCMTSCMTRAYTCPQERILQADLLEVIKKNIREQAKYAVDLSQIWKEQQRHKILDKEALKKNESVKKLTMLKEFHNNLETDVRELYEKFVFGELDKEKYLELKRAALEKCGHISKQIEELKAVLDHAGTNEKPENKITETSSQYTEIEELADNMIADVLQKVIVYPDKKLIIVWNYQDEFKNFFEQKKYFSGRITADSINETNIGQGLPEFTNQDKIYALLTKNF